MICNADDSSTHSLLPPILNALQQYKRTLLNFIYSVIPWRLFPYAFLLKCATHSWPIVKMSWKKSLPRLAATYSTYSCIRLFPLFLRTHGIIVVRRRANEVHERMAGKGAFSYIGASSRGHMIPVLKCLTLLCHQQQFQEFFLLFFGLGFLGPFLLFFVISIQTKQLFSRCVSRWFLFVWREDDRPILHRFC